MRKFIALLALVILTLRCFGQNPSAANVFGSKLLKSISTNDGSYEFTYNDAGQLVKVVETDKYGDTDEIDAFDYTTGTKNGSEYHVILTRSFSDGEDLKCYLRLGDNNFVEYCYEEYYGDDDTDSWSFEYNAEGQLCKMVRSEGGESGEITTMTYNDGDITRVVQTGIEEGDEYITSISYTSETVVSPIDNTDKIMLFDHCFSIDMDELGVAYFAGLLGNPTKHLPVVQDGDEYFLWETNADNSQTYMTTLETYDGYKTETTFAWINISSAITSIDAATKHDGKIYDVNGVRLCQPRRGLNIVNGKKVLVK